MEKSNARRYRNFIKGTVLKYWTLKEKGDLSENNYDNMVFPILVANQMAAANP
jgi:hypothetical protein